MKTRTDKEVQAEIKSLEACKGYIPHYTAFGDNNWDHVDLQIDFLRGNIDTTADEYLEMSDDEQSCVNEAKNWLECDSDESPSSGWDNYRPKSKK